MDCKLVYLEPNRDLYISHFPFLMSGILGVGSFAALKAPTRMRTLNFLTMAYDRMQVTRRKEKLPFLGKFTSSYDQATRIKNYLASISQSRGHIYTSV